MSGSLALSFDLPKQVLSGTVAKATQAVVSFVGMIAFANILGPSSYGGVVFFLVVVGSLKQPMAGWSTAVHKHVAESDGDPGVGLGLLAAFALAWTAIVAVPLTAVSDLFAGRTGLTHATLLAVAYLLTNEFVETTYSVLEGMGYVGRAYWVETLRRVLSVVLRIAAVLAFGAVGMVYGSIAVSLLFAPFVLYLVGTRPSLPTRESVREHFAFAKHSIPSSVLGSIAKRIDVLMLGLLASQAAVGEYEVAWQLTVPGIFVAEALSRGVFTRVSALSSEGADSESTIRMGTYASVIAVPVFFGAGAMGERLVDLLFGPGYAGAVPLLVGLAFYRVFRAQNEPIEGVLSGLDRPDLLLRSTVGTFCVNVGLGYALVLEYGAIGVVVATVVAELVRFGLMSWYLGTLVGGVRPSFFRPLGSQFAAGAAMFLVVRVAADALAGADADAVGTVLLLALGACSYTAALLAISTGHRSVAAVVADSVVGGVR